MTERDFRRPGYLIGGHRADGHEPEQRKFVPASDAIEPYTDRKLMRSDDAPLDMATIVDIQRMACAGIKRDAIFLRLAAGGVTMAQIARVLDPSDEAPRPNRRPARAGVGYAALKGRR